MVTVLHAIRNLDIGIYYWLSRFSGNVILCHVVRQEESNNLLKGAIFFALLWRYWFRGGRREEERRCDIVAILTGSILAIVAARTIAFIAPFQLRAIDDPTVLHPVYALPFTPNLEHWSAFPSDTAAYFFALAIGIAYLSRRSGIPVMLYTIVWVCLPRMFLGIHYASDIVVGLGIGAFVVLLSIKSRLVHSLIAQPLVAKANRNSGWFYPVAFLISFEMATVFRNSRMLGHAVLDLVAAGLHFRALGTASQYTPMETWGGLVGIVACAAAFAYIFRTFSRMFRAWQSRHSISGEKRDSSTRLPTIGE